jgi:hypothetical protein
MDLGPAISEALATLPPHYRVTVVLVDVEGQAYEEAAEVLGVAVGTVRSRLFRGRRLLQDLLCAHARDAGFAGATSPAARPAGSSSAADGQVPPRAGAPTPSAAVHDPHPRFRP